VHAFTLDLITTWAKPSKNKSVHTFTLDLIAT
jgi:hypothetical protein